MIKPHDFSDEIVINGSINSFESTDEFNNSRGLKAHMDGKIYKVCVNI